ncbi:hypothetical protein IE53DRAFT_389450 [Violaceomyces palustris]|uniref:Uncharacterized protein n=1 Tax=Violaceomyces palustris TaxID=1673888 RepID=A0ACD0NRE2_9BASI|nr:hypothetical protein IE53DRAFT_389450 [Violaceomyces palustris]
MSNELSSLITLIDRSTSQQQQSHQLAQTLQVRLHALAIAQRAIVHLEAKRIQLEKDCFQLCSTSQFIHDPSVRLPLHTPRRETLDPAVTQAAGASQKRHHYGLGLGHGSSSKSRPSQLASQARLRLTLSEQVSSFAELHSKALEDFECSWKWCMCQAQSWDTSLPPSNKSNQWKRLGGGGGGAPKDDDGKGKSKPAAAAPPRSVKSWLDPSADHDDLGPKLSHPSADLVVKVLKAGMNDLKHSARCFVEQAQSEHLPGGSTGAPSYSSILALISASHGPRGVLLFSEAIFIEAARDLLGSEPGRSEISERLLLELLDTLESINLELPPEHQAEAGARSRKGGDAFRPSPRLELEVLDYLKQACESQVDHAQVSFQPLPLGPWSPRNVSAGPLAAAGASLSHLGNQVRSVSSPYLNMQPIGASLAAFGNNAADLWNASIHGSVTTIGGLWNTASSIAQTKAATESLHDDRQHTPAVSKLKSENDKNATPSKRPRRDPVRTSNGGNPTPSKVPSSLSLARYVTPASPSTGSSSSLLGVIELPQASKRSPSSSPASTSRFAFLTREPGSPSLPEEDEDASSISKASETSRATSSTASSGDSVLASFVSNPSDERVDAQAKLGAIAASARDVPTEGGHSARTTRRKAVSRPGNLSRVSSRSEGSEGGVRSAFMPNHLAVKAARVIADTLNGAMSDDSGQLEETGNPRVSTSDKPSSPSHFDRPRSFQEPSASRDPSVLGSRSLLMTLIRRLLLIHFPAATCPEEHRKLKLLIIIRWYAFVHLRQLLTRPERYGRGVSGGEAFWGASSIRLDLFDQEASVETFHSARRVFAKEREATIAKAMEDVWLADSRCCMALNDLHRTLYLALVKVTGFGTSVPAGGGEGSPTDNQSLLLEASVRRLVNSFGGGNLNQVAAASLQVSGSDEGQGLNNTFSTFAIGCDESLSLVGMLTPVYEEKCRIKDAIRDAMKIKRDPSELPDSVSSPKNAATSSIVREAATEKMLKELGLVAEAAARWPVDDQRRFAVLHSARRPRDGKVFLEQTVQALESHLTDWETGLRGKATERPFVVSDLNSVAALATRRPSYSKAVHSSDPATHHREGIPTTGSGFSVGSSSTGTNRVYQASEVSTWNSPPCSPFSEGSGEDYFHQADANSVPIPSRRSDGRSHKGDDTPTMSPTAMSSANGSRVTTMRRKLIATSSGGSLPSVGPPSVGSPETFHSAPGQHPRINYSLLPVGEIRRGLSTLIRKGHARDCNASISALLSAAVARARSKHEFIDAALFERTLSLLEYCRIVEPGTVSFGRPRPGDMATSAEFAPLLAHIASPLKEADRARRRRERLIRLRLTDVQSYRAELVEQARSLYNRLQELRARAWYASEIRTSPEVMTACATARAKFEAALHPGDDDDQADGTEEVGVAAVESGSEWMQKLGVHDLKLEEPYQNYLRDLDPAFQAIVDDASRFFVSPIWQREASQARPFLPTESAAIQGVESTVDGRIILAFGSGIPELLHGDEQSSQTIVGLETFLQKVQLSATGLLMSEALRGVRRSERDAWFSERAAKTGQLEHRDPGLAARMGKAGARQLLRRFDLHPSPHHKMRALLLLNRLAVAHLSWPDIPILARVDSETSKVIQEEAVIPRAESLRSTSFFNGIMGSIEAATRIFRPASPLKRPLPRRRGSTASRNGSSRPVSIRASTNHASNAKAARRALSMYEAMDEGEEASRGSEEEEEEEGDQDGGGGESGDEGAGGLPSIQNLLASLALQEAKLFGQGVSDFEATASKMTTTTSVSPSSAMASRDPLLTNKASLATTSVGREDEGGYYKGATISIEPPTTDAVVNLLETILLETELCPTDLFLGLQVICAFSPSSILDFKDEGKAMWDAVLASSSIRQELAEKCLEEARHILALSKTPSGLLLLGGDEEEVRRSARTLFEIAQREGCKLSREEKEMIGIGG